MLEEKELERYKQQIDEDFEVFPINKRFIRLEKAWIANISHKVMPSKSRFIHIDRKNLRKALIKYLNEKRKEADKRGKILKE